MSDPEQPNAGTRPQPEAGEKEPAPSSSAKSTPVQKWDEVITHGEHPDGIVDIVIDKR